MRSPPTRVPLGCAGWQTQVRIRRVWAFSTHIKGIQRRDEGVCTGFGIDWRTAQKVNYMVEIICFVVLMAAMVRVRGAVIGLVVVFW